MKPIESIHSTHSLHWSQWKETKTASKCTKTYFLCFRNNMSGLVQKATGLERPHWSLWSLGGTGGGGSLPLGSSTPMLGRIGSHFFVLYRTGLTWKDQNLVVRLRSNTWTSLAMPVKEPKWLFSYSVSGQYFVCIPQCLKQRKPVFIF